jgi:hypothetical protein
MPFRRTKIEETPERDFLLLHIFVDISYAMFDTKSHLKRQSVHDGGREAKGFQLAGRRKKERELVFKISYGTKTKVW